MTKRAKGNRPIYLDDPHVDRLLAIVMALAGEVAVLRDRLDTVERLAAAKGVLTHDDIETYQPDEQAAQAREQWRTEYLARLMRILEEEVDALK